MSDTGPNENIDTDFTTYSVDDEDQPSNIEGLEDADVDDPRDRNIRLAPTFPELPEVTAAMEAVVTCVLLAAAEKVNAEQRL